MKPAVAVRALFGLLVLSSVAHAAVSASSNPLMPSQNTSHFFVSGGFQIDETVAFNASFGPWLKHLVNGGAGHPSGQNIPIVETLTNTGSATWTDWHEEVRSRTDIPGGPGDEVGFLFDNSSLSVQANYGAGFVPLVQGVDYTVVPTLYSGPPDPGNNGHWEAVSIFFAPARSIETGDQLRIQKNIFEVFGDGDPWRPEEEAILGQFPSVPEPSGLLAGTISAVFVIIARRQGRPVMGRSGRRSALPCAN